MITIKYNVTLTNPIKEQLKATDTKSVKSNLSINRTSKGINIRGKYDNTTYVSEASDYFSLGSKYRLIDANKMTTTEKMYKIEDVVEVLKLDKTNYRDIPISLRSRLNKVTPLKDNLNLLGDILENSDDIVLFEVNSQGILNKINVEIKNNTNIFYYDTKNLLVYFMVNKALKLDPLNNKKEISLHISNKELISLPEGFCTLTTNTLKRKEILYQLDTNLYLLNSKQQDDFTSNFPIYVDGVLTNNFQTSLNEQILLSLNTNVVFLNTVDLELDDNITAIYLLNNEGKTEPYLLYCDSKTISDLGIDPITPNFKIRQSTLSSSEENKKRYIVKQYKIKLKSNNSLLEIIDNDFYTSLKYNAMQFNKKVIVNG